LPGWRIDSFLKREIQDEGPDVDQDLLLFSSREHREGGFPEKKPGGIGREKEGVLHARFFGLFFLQGEDIKGSREGKVEGWAGQRDRVHSEHPKPRREMTVETIPDL
jgi:hypothetical protein